MAEIRVEQKKGGLGWLWTVIALIVAAALIWYLVSRNNASTTDVTTPADSARTSMAVPSLAPPATIITLAA